jgi:hypothetical protein
VDSLHLLVGLDLEKVLQRQRKHVRDWRIILDARSVATHCLITACQKNLGNFC